MEEFRKLYRKNGYVVNYNKIIMKKECRVVQLLWKDQNFFHNLWCCEMVCVDDEISEQIVPLLLFFYPNYTNSFIICEPTTVIK
jgi:hypothetical protein